MEQQDRDSYKMDTTAKHELMKKSYELLKKFFVKASKNWYS